MQWGRTLVSRLIAHWSLVCCEDRRGMIVALSLQAQPRATHIPSTGLSDLPVRYSEIGLSCSSLTTTRSLRAFRSAGPTYGLGPRTSFRQDVVHAACTTKPSEGRRCISAPTRQGTPSARLRRGSGSASSITASAFFEPIFHLVLVKFCTAQRRSRAPLAPNR